ncbi:MAG TPA: isoprenylcysteine carboxylmethyltransferase family protein [Acidimicrobiales bacterium]|nr:isoprenylcysteine carboxylmethyltransferase family protein [Acidimicrobiales bacterium]
MHRRRAAAVTVTWGGVLGGTFGGLLPWLLGYWHFHEIVAHWLVAQVAGAILIAAGIASIVVAFAEFIRAQGTPVPIASPPRLVVRGPYRHVRNPIYVGFVMVLLGQTLLFGSRGLLEYTAIALGIGAAAVRFYEEPILARRFGADYDTYRNAVRAWIPRMRPGCSTLIPCHPSRTLDTDIARVLTEGEPPWPESKECHPAKPTCTRGSPTVSPGGRLPGSPAGRPNR